MVKGSLWEFGQKYFDKKNLSDLLVLSIWAKKIDCQNLCKKLFRAESDRFSSLPDSGKLEWNFLWNFVENNLSEFDRKKLDWQRPMKIICLVEFEWRNILTARIRETFFLLSAFDPKNWFSEPEWIFFYCQNLSEFLCRLS